MRILTVGLLLGLLGGGLATVAQASVFEKTQVDQGISAYQKGDYKLARKWLSSDAAADDPRGWYYLGQLYQNGQGGFDLDLKRAEKLYHQAAEQGQSDAMLALADLYSRGAGVTPNLAVARVWYEKAAKAGSVNGMVHLADDLAGKYGLPPDYDRARVWYEQAAATGSAEAMVGLGSIYRNGWGVDVNRVEALKWYRLAVQYGSQEAQKPEGLLRMLTSLDEQQQADKLAVEWEALVGRDTFTTALKNQPTPEQKVVRGDPLVTGR